MAASMAWLPTCSSTCRAHREPAPPPSPTVSESRKTPAAESFCNRNSHRRLLPGMQTGITPSFCSPYGCSGCSRWAVSLASMAAWLQIIVSVQAPPPPPPHTHSHTSKHPVTLKPDSIFLAHVLVKTVCWDSSITLSGVRILNNVGHLVTVLDNYFAAPRSTEPLCTSSGIPNSARLTWVSGRSTTFSCD